MENAPEKPVYTCAGSADEDSEPCPAPALLAEDLNRHLLSKVMSMIITSATEDNLQGSCGREALAEAGHEDPGSG